MLANFPQCGQKLRGVGLVCWAAGALACLPAHAQEAPRFDYGEIGGVFETPGERDGYLSFGALGDAYDSYAAWKNDFTKRTGFSWLIEDRMINQWGNGTNNFDNELNVIARYEFARQAPSTWSLNVWGQFANTLGDNTGADFQSDLGILSPLNGGNSGPDKSNQILHMLSLEYINPSETLRFQAGKLALRTLVNLNRYAHGDSDSFFSPMLGNNSVVPYTALLGLGVFAQYRADTWYLSGVARAPDTELGWSTDALQSGDREFIVEAALTPTIPGLGYGEYRLTWSKLEANDTLPEVETLSLSFDQDIGERVGAFFRYAKSDDTFRDFQSRIAAGMILKKPFGYTHDRVGLGLWQGDPTDPDLGHETGVEMFYRAQVSPALQVTPDIQYLSNPANSSSASELVFGLRFRLEL